MLRKVKDKITKLNVVGEVKNPGFFPISINSTSIKNVIKMAGGFTQRC